ncbi:MAG: DUF393 domain-containing protein [Parachlamydiaceae bacterium]|nr:DUF393 domain-containing protein [Parachlamydiaceae bacterium]
MEKPERQHLVFYDGECGLCDRVVQFLLHADKKREFQFASLQGKTAQRFLNQILVENDSVVLVEDYELESRKYYVMSKAAFRISWLLGGFWKVIGVLSFFPSWLFDWLYRFVARHRKQWFSDACTLPTVSEKERFLD